MRRRRSRAELEALNAALVRLAAALAPASVRQIFYAATTEGVIPKTEQAYKRVVERLKVLRLAGWVPWSHIADRSRWQRKPLTFPGIEAAIEHTRRTYRRAVWQDLDERVYIVLEKDALVGVVGDVTEEYDVPLLVTRGFSSLSFTHGLAEDVGRNDAAGIDTYVYALGDWDPSGIKAHEAFEDRLAEWCDPLAYTFERIAVKPDQIVAWNLPSRPTKQSTHATRWTGGESVELDAIRPARLRTLVYSTIEQHLPAGHLKALEAAEQSEREALRVLTHK